MLAVAGLVGQSLGDDLPGPLTWESAPTAWVVGPVPMLAVAVVGGVYVAGVLRLRRRGDHWPLGRSLAFLVGGLGTIVVALESFLGAYDHVLISAHMAQHMLLWLVAPLFLALGAPITLALRALHGRPRQVMLHVVHSRAVAVLTFPLVAATLYIVSPWVLYYSPLFEATLRSSVLHGLSQLLLVLVGFLWYWALLGTDPLPKRPSYPMRLIAIFAMLPFVALLGVAIMNSSRILAQDYLLSLHRAWGPSLSSDQQVGGMLTWICGDLTALILLWVIFLQWTRASEREARELDRRLDLEEAAAAAAAASAESAPSAVAAPPAGSSVPDRPPTVAGGPAPSAP